MKTINLKDKITNYAKWMVLIAGFILALPLLMQTTYGETIVLPHILKLTCEIVGIASIYAGLHFTGKNSDGSTKTIAQLTTNAIATSIKEDERIKQEAITKGETIIQASEEDAVK